MYTFWSHIDYFVSNLEWPVEVLNKDLSNYFELIEDNQILSIIIFQNDWVIGWFLNC